MELSDAVRARRMVRSYDPGSPGAMSYLDAAKELAEQGPAA